MIMQLKTMDSQVITFHVSPMGVFLQGKFIGTIEFDRFDKVYRYWPAAHQAPGEPFQTLEECQRSLL
jgi:hypothetical protein